jgi:hypothetical protein
MQRDRKPIRKCHGCGLNLGDHCAVFESPRRRWHRRICTGYKNDTMLAAYRDAVAKHPPDTHKQARRALAKQRGTQTHHQEMLPLSVR